MTEEKQEAPNVPGLDHENWIMQVPEHMIQPHNKEPDDSFVENVRVRGQLEPVFLYDNPEIQKLEILAGNRRVGACRALDYPVMAFVVPVEVPREEALMMALTFNLQRSRNRPDEARRVDELMKLGYTPQKIAEAIGVRVTEIKSLVKMMSAMHPDVKKKFSTGELTKSAAKELVKLPQDKQKEMLESGVTGTKELSREVRSFQNDAFDALDQIEVPNITPDETLGTQVEQAAGKYSGDNRKALLKAAAILRGS
jgi:ParB/RepB/Spo0J family partition protein